MNDQQLGLLIESWLKDSDHPPGDVGWSTAQIESRLPQTRQWSRLWPLPFLARLSAPMAGLGPAGGFTMFSAVKTIAAAIIVALFGVFLLSGVLTTPQNDEALPATVTESPSPTTDEQSFPTGTFTAEEDGLTLELRADGTCQRAGVACTFGVNRNLFSEMTFEDPSGAQVPATYYWDFDGERLTFKPWGVDKQPDRKAVYTDHVYVAVGETRPLPVQETGFPTGRFVPSGGSEARTLWLLDGSYRKSTGGNGRVAVSGDLFTEMAFNPGASNIEMVPATYHWDWDGERLMFRLWGEDSNQWRRADLLGHVFVRDETAAPGSTRTLLLSHPRLDEWVTVAVSQRDDGSYEATATIDEDPLGEGTGDTLQEAVRVALEALGEPYASDMAESVKH